MHENDGHDYDHDDDYVHDDDHDDDHDHGVAILTPPGSPSSCLPPPISPGFMKIFKKS